jgi:hypothetical protein
MVLCTTDKIIEPHSVSVITTAWNVSGRTDRLDPGLCSIRLSLWSVVAPETISFESVHESVPVFVRFVCRQIKSNLCSNLFWLCVTAACSHTAAETRYLADISNHIIPFSLRNTLIISCHPFLVRSGPRQVGAPTRLIIWSPFKNLLNLS